MLVFNDEILTSGSQDGSIKVWDLTQGKLKYTFDKTNGISFIFLVHLNKSFTGRTFFTSRRTQRCDSKHD